MQIQDTNERKQNAFSVRTCAQPVITALENGSKRLTGKKGAHNGRAAFLNDLGPNHLPQNN